MNSLTVVALLAVASISSGSLIALSPASGSVGVGIDGAVIVGPSGSVRTNNGLAGLGAGAQLSGPAGDVRTLGGAVELDGSGIGGLGVGIAVPAVARIGVQTIAPVAITKVGGIGLAGINGIGLSGINGIGLNGIGGIGLAGVNGIGLAGVNGIGLGGINGVGKLQIIEKVSSYHLII